MSHARARKVHSSAPHAHPRVLASISVLLYLHVHIFITIITISYNKIILLNFLGVLVLSPGIYIIM